MTFQPGNSTNRQASGRPRLKRLALNQLGLWVLRSVWQVNLGGDSVLRVLREDPTIQGSAKETSRAFS